MTDTGSAAPDHLDTLGSVLHRSMYKNTMTTDTGSTVDHLGTMDTIGSVLHR